MTLEYQSQQAVAPPPLQHCSTTSDTSWSAFSSDESIASFPSDESTASLSDLSTISLSSGNTSAVRVQELLSDKRALQREIDELKATVEKRDEAIVLLQQDKTRTLANYYMAFKNLEKVYSEEVQLQTQMKEQAEAFLGVSQNAYITFLKQQIQLLLQSQGGENVENFTE